MSCLEVRALLPLRKLSVLEDDEETLVRSHLDGCSACAEDAQRHDAALAVLEGPRATDEPREGAANRVWDKLLADASKAAPDAAPAPTPTPDLAISLVCSFCHDGLTRNDACYCASCLAPHHDECFRAHGRCSAFGCEETRTVRPTLEVLASAPRPRPRSRLRGFLSGVALVATGGLAAAALTRAGGSHALHRSADDVQMPGDEIALPKPTTAAAAAAAAAADEAPITSSDVDAMTLLLDPRRRAAADAAPVTSGDGVIPEITVEDADLRDVMDQIGRTVGKNIIVEPDIHEKVTISLRGIPWRDAVDVIAKMCKCEVQERGSILVLAQPVDVTIQFTDANVRTVLQLLASYAGKNVVISPQCQGDVTLDLHGVHWLEALAAIVKACHFHAACRNDVIVVSTESMGGDELTLDEELASSTALSALKPDPSDLRRIDLVAENRDLRDVCDEIARKLDMKIVVEPDVHAAVTLTMRDAPWRDVLDCVAKASHVAIEARGPILVVTQAPRVTLQASATPAPLWFQLLAAYAGKALVFVGPSKPDEVTLDLHDVQWMTAIETTATVYGYEVHEVKGSDMLRISVDEKARAKLHAAEPKVVAPSHAVEVTFASGRKLTVALEAILRGDDDRSTLMPDGQPASEKKARVWAVISGRPYREGERLHVTPANGDNNEETIPVKVAAIQGRTVVLEAFEDPGRPRVTLELERPPQPGK